MCKLIRYVYLTRICKYVRCLKNSVPRQETATDNTPNLYTNFSRRHQNTVLHHRNGAIQHQNNAAVASSEEQAVEVSNNSSSTENDHPINCDSQSEKQNQNSERGYRRDYMRSMSQHQQLTTGLNSTNLGPALTCDIQSFTESFPLKNERVYSYSGKAAAQSEMYQVTTTHSLNVSDASTKINQSIYTCRKKETSV